MNFIGDFERSLSEEAQRRNVEGVICGHIHHAASKMIGDVHYINTGDWVESCTAVAEKHDGSLELIRWSDVQQSKQVEEVSPTEMEVAA